MTSPPPPEQPVIALIEELLLYLDDTDSTAQFEAIGDRFYAATGFLRPGKSEPMEMYSSDREERRIQAWIAWCREWKRGLISQLEALLVVRHPQLQETKEDTRMDTMSNATDSRDRKSVV